MIPQESPQTSSFFLGSTTESLGPLMRLASLLLCCYWTALFVGTHLPSAAMPDLKVSDKVYHLAAFAGLAFLLAWALPKRSEGLLRHFSIVFAIGLGYALMDEWSQRFIPGRVGDRWDVAADACGVVIGFGFYLVLRATCIRVAFLRRVLVAVSR